MTNTTGSEGSPPPSAEGSEPELSLEIGHSCHRMLVWDLGRVATQLASRLPEGLLGLGYFERSFSKLVQELGHPEGHSVVVVPRTGRLQIRVHYLTPIEAREAAARRVADDVASSLGCRVVTRRVPEASHETG